MEDESLDLVKIMVETIIKYHMPSITKESLDTIKYLKKEPGLFDIELPKEVEHLSDQIKKDIESLVETINEDSKLSKDELKEKYSGKI